MSLARCIPELLAEGKLTPEQAAAAEAVYGRRVSHHRKSMGEAAADALASTETAEALAVAAARRKRLALLTVDAQQRALASTASYAGAGDPLDPRAIVALFDRDEKAPYANVEARRKAIKAQAHAEIDRILAEHRRTITGKLRDPAQMAEIGRELFGEKTGSLAASEMADAWTRTADMLRRRFNAAGGAIGRIDRWGLPQSHDSVAVRRAGWQAWRDELWPRLDRERMIDEDSGLPFDDAALEGALRDVFETIRTDGFNKLEPGGSGGRRSLANRRAEHRFLHFRSYDDWAAYQARFGAGTAFDAMMGHVEAMSRDIAAMEIFGPNPAATVRWLKDGMEKNAALHGDDAGKAGDKAFASGREVDRLWAQYSGALNRPASRRIALGFGAVRAVQTSAKLGGATLSAVTDLAFQASTRRYNGLRAASMIGDYAKLLASESDRRFAVRRGLIAEEWSAMTAAQNRYLVEELTGETASRLAEGTLRLSGLSAWTQAGRWAFGMEFLDTLQGQFGRGYDAVEPVLKRALERYGIGAADWEAFRAAPLDRHGGESWFMPANVADQGARDKLLQMILTETDYAVPVADLRTQALINSVAPRGTIAGELARSMFLFKSFGIAVVLGHGRRALGQASLGGKIGYAAGLTIGMTLLGGLAMQLKAIAGGKDPRPMDDPSFWASATIQGGGFGIFGDFLSAAENRFGGGLAATAGGPVLQTTGNVGDLIVGNLAKAVRGDNTDLGHDVTRLIDQELPGQSLWYARLAFDRVVTDQIQSLIDPNYAQSWRRMSRASERDYGQGLWWQRGELAPERAPDLENMLGGSPEEEVLQ